MEYLFFFILLFEILFFSYLEKRVFKTIITPITLLGYPILIVLLAYFYKAKEWGFISLSPNVILVWIIGILIFGITFFIVAIPLDKIKFAKKQVYKPVNTSILAILTFIISFVVLFTGFLPWYKIHQFNDIGSDLFTSQYGGGLSGHFINLAILVCIYIIATIERQKKILWLLLIINFSLIVLYQVKTWMFITLLAGLILRFFIGNQRTINIKIASLIALLSFFFFYLAYYFSVNIENDLSNEIYIDFLFKHFRYYLFSGILGFSEWFKHGMIMEGSVQYFFSPIITFASLIFGVEKVEVVNDNYFLINPIQDRYSNVRTMFGAIIEFGNYYIFGIYTFLLSFSIYFIYFIAFIKKNIWILMLLAFILAPLTVGMFDFYYNNLSYIEIPVYIIIIYLFTSLKK